MPTINKRFLVHLVLAVAALAGLLAGAHALQARRIPEALKGQADRAAPAGKTDAAVHYLRQYLEFQPEDVPALEQLADLLRMRDPTPRGLTELVFLYDRILRIDPDRHPVRREALAACLKMARYPDAITHAETLLATFPTDAPLWQQLGAAQAGFNKLPEARASYETAITHAPDVLLGYHFLAQLLWKNMAKPGEAKVVYDRLVAALPLDPVAYYARAKFDAFLLDEAAQKGQPVNPEPVLRDLRRVLELDPEHASASLLLAEILQKGRDVPAAHAILRDATSLYPRDLRIVRSLAWLEVVRGNIPAAMAVLEDGLKHTPDGFDLLVPLADLLVQQGDTVRTAAILKRLEDRRAQPVQAKYLKTRLAMRDEKWAEAAALLDALRTETTTMPGLDGRLNLLLAQCAEKTGDAAGQETALKRVAAADPGNAAVRVALATLYLNQGRFDDAGREYDAAVQSPYVAGTVHADAVRFKARRLRTTPGGGSPEDWRKLEQATASAAARFGVVAAGAKPTTPVGAQSLTPELRVSPASSDGALLWADVLTAQGKYAEAVQLLRKEATHRPGDTRLWAALAETAADAGGTATGLAVIDEAQAAAGDGPELRLARALLYAREPGRVRPIDALGGRTDSWAEADQLRLLAGLIEVYDQAGDRAKVVQTLRRFAAHRPTDRTLWLRLHERATDAGDPAAAAEARAALVKIEGEAGPSVVVCDANPDRLLAAFGPSPNRADACLALARAKAAAGDTAAAGRLTERAFVLEPTRYETARAWVAFLCGNGTEDRAAKLITRLATDHRWAGERFRRIVGGVLERLPPPAGAKLLAACRPLVERDPGGPAWLARAYATVGRPADAEAVLVAATRARTATADDWLRLALHHAAAGQKDAAAETLQAARGTLAAPAFFAVAAAYRETPGGTDWAPAVTDPAEKRAATQARLAVKLSRSEPAEAAKVLEGYLTEDDLRPADAGWARRNLAMLYALDGSADERVKAMGLLRDAPIDPANPDELRATAGVLTTLAKYLEVDDRKLVLARAAEVLTLAHQTSRSPRDLYNLSQLHRVAGNRPACRGCLQQLLNADRANIYYLIAALEEITEAREFQAGDTFAKFLLAHHPGEFRALAAVARYECKAGRPDRALALAEGYAGAADAGAGDHLVRAARVAELLDELARYPDVRGTPVARKMIAAAVERYAALVPTRPEAVIAIVGLLALEGRVADAFTRIDQHARGLPARIKAAAGLAALRAGGATDAQFDSVRAWVAAALKDEPGSVSLRLNEAEFFALEQKYDRAAAVYEALLAREPRNVVVLNNLAWLLAADPATAPKAAALVDRATREAGLTGELLETRARVRITLKQFAAAEKDLTEALTQDATALRLFHLALLKLAQSPPLKAEAVEAFRRAKARGLDVRAVHPADVAAYRLLEAEANRPAN